MQQVLHIKTIVIIISWNTPSCLRSEARLPTDQRIVCSDCCQKCISLYCV